MTCTNPEFSKDIGPYELRLMSADDSRRFRAHLLECEDCFRELYKMAPVAGWKESIGKAITNGCSTMSARMPSFITILSQCPMAMC